MREPTAVERRILAYISRCVEERGLPPTLREIGSNCGISSTGSVSYHLRNLERQGLLRRRERASRAIETLGAPGKLPILGRVGAGGSVLAEEDAEALLAVGRDVAGGADFLLRVRGESMSGAGILPGDLVAVRRDASPREGEIVVALLGENAVVKRLGRHGSAWRLESAHPDHPPITEEFHLVGKVVGLIRSY